MSFNTIFALTTNIEALDPNTDFSILWVLLSGILVFFMQAGFTLVESGFTKSSNAVNISMKNILDISVGTLSFWLIGYGLMYGGSSNGFFITELGDLFFNPGAGAEDVFFQTVFCATAATIVSGAIAGRTKYSTYALFTIIMTAIIYPIAGGWEWNGGWLNAEWMPAEFIDFAGSSIVHSVGGWAALVGAWMVGPRIGKFVNGKAVSLPGSNLLLGTLGVFILWLGWFGFNGGSQLAWGGDNSVAAAMVVFVTNISAAAGALGALLISWYKFGKPNLAMTLNGVIAGLVAITAGCGNMTPQGAFFAGLVGGILVVYSIEFIEKVLKIDDAVGAASAHGVVGAWGTLVIGIWGVDGDTGIGLLNGGGGAQLGAQAIGVLAYGAWAAITSFIVFYVLKITLGLRVSKEEEENLDMAEHGEIGFAGKRTRE